MKKLLLGVAVATVSLASTGALAADAAAGKAKAAVCAACHGAAGVSMIPIYPNLAGQKEMYIVKQLKAFKSGSRPDPVMKGQTAMLSDGDMANLAAYYASLKP